MPASAGRATPVLCGQRRVATHLWTAGARISVEFRTYCPDSPCPTGRYRWNRWYRLLSRMKTEVFRNECRRNHSRFVALALET
jgi:hypothetical protein